MRENPYHTFQIHPTNSDLFYNYRILNGFLKSVENRSPQKKEWAKIDIATIKNPLIYQVLSLKNAENYMNKEKRKLCVKKKRPKNR